MLLGIRDDAVALDLDVALAERARQETWQHLREQNHEPDWFASILLLVMDLV